MSLYPPKLQFPNIAQAAFRPFLSDVRLKLQEWAQWVDAPPPGATQQADRKVNILGQIRTFANYLGGAVVANGGTLTGVAPTGAYVTTVTFTVNSAGAITAIALS